MPVCQSEFLVYHGIFQVNLRWATFTAYQRLSSWTISRKEQQQQQQQQQQQKIVYNGPS